MTTLWWLGHDLRLADNPALATAIALGRPLLPVFVLDSRAPLALGGAGRWWLHHSLSALEKDLAGRGIPLVRTRGAPESLLPALAHAIGATTVVWNRPSTPDAAHDVLHEALIAHGLTPRPHAANLLWDHPDAGHKADNTPYQVFTPFWRQGRTRAVSPPLPAPTGPLPAVGAPPPSESLDAVLLPRPDWAGGLRDTWLRDPTGAPGETGALARLARLSPGFFQNYEQTRDRPDRDGTSALSAALHFGEISARTLWHAAGDTGEGFRRQLAWREFCHQLLFAFPHMTTTPLRQAFTRFPWREDEDLFHAWTAGRTGYPLVDAAMRALWHTGWLHNRVRMVAGSFLVKHLRLPWTWGEQWFRDTLVDADVANNAGGWQWVAGCGADAAPYFRILNPARQASRFDPDNTYQHRWGPRPGMPAPPPIVDHATAREEALAAYRNLREV